MEKPINGAVVLDGQVKDEDSTHTTTNQANKRISPTFKDEIFSHASELEQQASQASNRNGLFVIRSANEWIREAKSRPVPKKLFDELWWENELCCLFASSNLGKSILAMAIANALSKGEPIRGFRMEMLASLVLYFDFEMSMKQFQGRYSNNYTDEYNFSDNLKRIELDWIFLSKVRHDSSESTPLIPGQSTPLSWQQSSGFWRASV